MDVLLPALAAFALFALASRAAALTRVEARTLGPAAPARMQVPNDAAGGAPVTDPRHAGRGDVALWVLHASPGCPLTRAVLDGRRFRTAEAIPLPTLGCCGATCRCHYEPVAEQRDPHERRAAPRRQTLREDGDGERRSAWARRVRRAGG